MSRLRAFGAFWWDFVIGDDWRVAAGLALAIGATALLDRAGVSAWWLLPPATIALLYASLRRAVKKSHSRPASVTDTSHFPQ
ncbi:MAG: hypothetical protein QOE36_495 [Gaiellaceae bacterium]|jgi:hypothetical protein|nr:hypothetical protein [Gaiellaceae bacterium]